MPIIPPPTPPAPPPGPLPYSWASYGFARQELANRLYDRNKVFWPDAELKLYICEALRTWNALTGYWRADFVFNSSPNTVWYDMTSTLVMPNTLRAFTLTDQSIYPTIQAHLLEPINWNPWTGQSSQFSVDDLTNALSRRRDEITSNTACTVTRALWAAAAGRTYLPDITLDIRRLAYLPALAGASTSVVWPDDTWGAESFEPNYTLNPAGIPFVYLQSAQPPISFDVDVAPAYGGAYELLVTLAQAQFNSSQAQLLYIPDDWSWVLKWGALTDLLTKDSEAADPLRAQYCEQRYRMALALMYEAPAVLAARIGNVPVHIDSVRSADLYSPTWQAQSAGTPTNVFYSGMNLVALSPMPSTGPYSVTLNVVENAPCPVNDTDLIQVGRDDLDTILKYAQHVASFKMGGAEFTDTIPLLKDFFTQAGIYNRKLSELGEFTTPLFALGSREKHENPVMVPDASTSAEGPVDSGVAGGVS